MGDTNIKDVEDVRQVCPSGWFCLGAKDDFAVGSGVVAELSNLSKIVKSQHEALRFRVVERAMEAPWMAGAAGDPKPQHFHEADKALDAVKDNASASAAEAGADVSASAAHDGSLKEEAEAKPDADASASAADDGNDVPDMDLGSDRTLDLESDQGQSCVRRAFV